MYEGFRIPDTVAKAALADTEEGQLLEGLLTKVNNRAIKVYAEDDAILYQFKKGTVIEPAFISIAIQFNVTPVVIIPDAISTAKGYAEKTIQTTPIKVWMSFDVANLTQFEDKFNAAESNAIDGNTYYFYDVPIIDPDLTISRETPSVLLPNTDDTKEAVDPAADVPPVEDIAV